MPPEFPVVPQPAPTLFFFGVTTGRSSSRRMFPAWAAILGLGDARLVGLDLPINGPPEVYRRAVHQIKHDPLSRGGIVTTHKINTLNAARDLFGQRPDDRVPVILAHLVILGCARHMPDRDRAAG